MEELNFVRRELKKAQGLKQWNEIALATSLTRTTFYSILKKEHSPNMTTIKKLNDYFKKVKK